MPDARWPDLAAVQASAPIVHDFPVQTPVVGLCGTLECEGDAVWDIFERNSGGQS